VGFRVEGSALGVKLGAWLGDKVGARLLGAKLGVQVGERLGPNEAAEGALLVGSKLGT